MAASCSPSPDAASVAGPPVRALQVIVPSEAWHDLSGDTRWIEVTGSFDHPAAQTCHSIVPVGDAEAAAIVERCRSSFVVTEYREVEAP